MTHTSLTKEQIGLDKITPSGISLYESCPKAFFYSNWLGLQLPQAMRHLNFGKAIHAAIDNIYNQYTADGGWSLAELSLAKKNFLQEWQPSSISEEDFKTVAERLECYEAMKIDGLDLVEAYWDTKELLLADGIDVTQVEIPIRIPLKHPTTDEVLPVIISGRLDGLTDSGRIVEFKTSSAKYDEMETRNKPQGLSYSYLYYMTRHKLPAGLDYIVLLKGRKKQRIQHIKIQHDESDIIAFFERVRVVLQKIANREFDRPKIGHARYCDCEKFEAALSY